MNRIDVVIPLKPHLHKFLFIETQQENFEQLTIDGNSPLGNFLYGLISKASKPQKIEGPRIAVNIPNRDKKGKTMDMQHSFPVVSKTNADRFNRLVEYLMCTRLFSRLELIDEQDRGHAKKYGKKKAEILRFCDKYNTEKQELNYDLLRMRYQRWKKNPLTLIKSAF